MSFNVALANPGLALITDLVIRANTGGDKTKETARAQEIANIILAVQQINAGNVATGLSDLQSALANPSSLTPGEALALQSFLSQVSTLLAALQAPAGATILGAAQNALFQALAATVLQVCAAYGAKTS